MSVSDTEICHLEIVFLFTISVAGYVYRMSGYVRGWDIRYCVIHQQLCNS